MLGICKRKKQKKLESFPHVNLWLSSSSSSRTLVAFRVLLISFSCTCKCHLPKIKTIVATGWNIQSIAFFNECLFKLKQMLKRLKTGCNSNHELILLHELWEPKVNIIVMVEEFYSFTYHFTYLFSM